MIRYPDLPLNDSRFGKLFPCPDCEVPAQAQRLQERLIGQSGLLPDEMGLTLDDIHERGPGSLAMINAARKMIDRPYGLLTFYGGPGNGKTRALQVIVSEFIRRGETAIYTRLADLLDYLRQGYEPGAEVETQDRYREVLDCRLLALDEFDKPRYTDWSREIIFTLIDDRYRYARQSGAMQKNTVLAMNSSPVDLPDFIRSRLEAGWIVRITDPDGRRYFH